MMMAPPQIIGVLLKKPGQHDDPKIHPRVPPLDAQEIKIRGELYVEDLGEQRMVTIRMGWLWVEGTPMRLPLRALNLRQAAPSLCQPHVSALGFTLSNPQNGTLATFWADTEPIYWSWVRAIAAELVRQTPFRAQRCLNFLEILTICPRGPVPLPDSPTESRRRSRSELRSWFRNNSTERQNNVSSTIDETRRRARSELRGWSSNSSDEDVLGEFRTIPSCIIKKKEESVRAWGFSESSEGSDDSLPWGGGGGQSSVDSVDSVSGTTNVITEPETREQRIQRYKEARRRENEARSRRVVEEDARRRKQRAEENNNNVSVAKLPKACNTDVSLKIFESNNNNTKNNNNNNNNNNNKNHNVVLLSSVENGLSFQKSSKREITTSDPCRAPVKTTAPSTLIIDDNIFNKQDKLSSLKKSSLVKVTGNFVRFEGERNSGNFDTVQLKNNDTIISTERKSRARERRSVREKSQQISINNSTTIGCNEAETFKQRKDRLASLSSRIPIPQHVLSSSSSSSTSSSPSSSSFNNYSILNTSVSSSSFVGTKSNSLKLSPISLISVSSTSVEPCEEAVARLLERCQRVDHYVPVRDKLTLFESLSRLGGRLARSTEDLGRVRSVPSPRGKQRARSLHDLNRAVKSVPVREMCRLFEGGEKCNDQDVTTSQRARLSDPLSVGARSRTWSDGNVVPPLTLPPFTLNLRISGSKNYPGSPNKSSNKKRQYVK